MDTLRRKVLLDLPEILKRANEPSPSITDEDFSFETWQPLLASIKPFLNEEISRLGISTDGKTEIELVKEVFTYQEKPNN